MQTKDWLEFLSGASAGAGLQLSDQQCGLFLNYMDELIKWNRTTNITRIAEPRAVALKHFLDSILIARYIDIACKKIADVGSGGGFPGIPLAIFEPACGVVVMESVGKKCAFLKHAVRALGLANVDVYHGRAEAFPSPPAFDIAVSRALGSISSFYAIAAPLVRPQGSIVCMKGRLPVDEIAELKKQKRGRFSIETHNYCLPEQGGERCLVVLKPCFT